MIKKDKNNTTRVNNYKGLSTWEVQYAYRQGLVDAFCILCEYMDDNFTDLTMEGNYNACDDMAHDLRSYISIISNIETKY